jgi:hypothetical protein
VRPSRVLKKGKGLASGDPWSLDHCPITPRDGYRYLPALTAWGSVPPIIEYFHTLLETLNVHFRASQEQYLADAQIDDWKID